MYAITTINVSFSTAFTESNKFCYFVFSFTFHLQCMTFLYLHSLIPFSFPSYFKWVYYMFLETIVTWFIEGQSTHVKGSLY